MVDKKYFIHLMNFLFRILPIHIFGLIFSLLPNHYFSNRVRGFFIGLFLKKCGKKFQLGRGVILNSPENIYIGNNCYISHYCYLQGKGQLVLKDNIIIGPMSILSTSKHKIVNNVPTNSSINSPIRINCNVITGSHVVVNSGVEIGENSIIGAGSVLTKNIPSYSFAYGSPAVNRRKK